MSEGRLCITRNPSTEICGDLESSYLAKVHVQLLMGNNWNQARVCDVVLKHSII